MPGAGLPQEALARKVPRELRQQLVFTRARIRHLQAMQLRASDREIPIRDHFRILVVHVDMSRSAVLHEGQLKTVLIAGFRRGERHI